MHTQENNSKYLPKTQYDADNLWYFSNNSFTKIHSIIANWFSQRWSSRYAQPEVFHYIRVVYLARHIYILMGTRG